MANHGINYEKASDICGLCMSPGYVLDQENGTAEDMKDWKIRIQEQDDRRGSIMKI